MGRRWFVKRWECMEEGSERGLRVAKKGRIQASLVRKLRSCEKGRGRAQLCQRPRPPQKVTISSSTVFRAAPRVFATFCPTHYSVPARSLSGAQSAHRKRKRA